jgi:hypothetical protein
MGNFRCITRNVFFVMKVVSEITMGQVCTSEDTVHTELWWRNLLEDLEGNGRH